MFIVYVLYMIPTQFSKYVMSILYSIPLALGMALDKIEIITIIKHTYSVNYGGIYVLELFSMYKHNC